MDSKYTKLDSSPLSSQNKNEHSINITSPHKKRKNKPIFHIPIVVVLSLLIILNIITILYDYITHKQKDKNCSQSFLYTHMIESIYIMMTDIVIISVISIKLLYRRIEYITNFLILSRVCYSSIIFGLNYDNISSCNIYKDLITKILFIDFGYMLIINLIYVIFIIVKIKN